MRIKLMTLCMALCCLCLNAFAQNVPDYVPTDGLVAWYPFNGNANDESGNGNDGIVNGATPSSDRHAIENLAYSFNGESSYILIESDFDSNERSVCLWVNTATFSPSLIYDNDHNGLYYGLTQFSCGFFGSDLFNGVGHPAGPNTFSQEASPETWYMLSFTRDSDSTRYFFNGSIGHAVANGNISSNGGPSHTWIGARRGAGDRFFHGSIDDIGSWNRALTAEEILALYNAELPILGCTDPTACNFDAEATSDDGSCIPSGCMESDACNYNELAECEGEACDYTCCPGPGCCLEGTVWDAELGGCIPIEATCPEDLDFDGVVGVNDLMELLSAFGTDCAPAEEPETAEWACGDPVNYHGYDYTTVQIGEQCWFAENLRTEYYDNGEAIPDNLSEGEWSSTTSGAVAVYGEGTSPVFNGSDDEVSNLADYGRLYNWYAVNIGNLCPCGWHVPTDGEFMTLELELGMSESEANAEGYRGTDQGTQMKSSPEDDPSWNGTNTSGFSGLAGGARSYAGDFSNEGINGYFWSATADGADAWSRVLNGGNTGVNRYNYGDLRGGFSVRCIKDTEE